MNAAANPPKRSSGAPQRAASRPLPDKEFPEVERFSAYDFMEGNTSCEGDASDNSFAGETDTPPSSPQEEILIVNDQDGFSYRVLSCTATSMTLQSMSFPSNPPFATDHPELFNQVKSMVSVQRFKEKVQRIRAGVEKAVNNPSQDDAGDDFARNHPQTKFSKRAEETATYSKDELMKQLDPFLEEFPEIQMRIKKAVASALKKLYDINCAGKFDQISFHTKKDLKGEFTTILRREMSDFTPWNWLDGHVITHSNRDLRAQTASFLDDRRAFNGERIFVDREAVHEDIRHARKMIHSLKKELTDIRNWAEPGKFDARGWFTLTPGSIMDKLIKEATREFENSLGDEKEIRNSINEISASIAQMSMCVQDVEKLVDQVKAQSETFSRSVSENPMPSAIQQRQNTTATR